MFKFDELSSISSFAGRKRYCDQHLTKIGSGSSRTTYDMGNGQVIKLAINGKGLSQNQSESDGGLGKIYPDE